MFWAHPVKFMLIQSGTLSHIVESSSDMSASGYDFVTFSHKYCSFIVNDDFSLFILHIVPIIILWAWMMNTSSCISTSSDYWLSFKPQWQKCIQLHHLIWLLVPYWKMASIVNSTTLIKVFCLPVLLPMSIQSFHEKSLKVIKKCYY